MKVSCQETSGQSDAGCRGQLPLKLLLLPCPLCAVLDQGRHDQDAALLCLLLQKITPIVLPPTHFAPAYTGLLGIVSCRLKTVATDFAAFWLPDCPYVC